ncbi:lactonase family protein [Streptosporangium sandarakinum]|uniref:lactonase family protein n=1 Tax=Streptosporangium nondiastaticum TaxID=35764 RepID=UPI0031F84C7C
MAEIAYIGGYTPGGTPGTEGTGPGITLMEPAGLTRVAETPAPSPSFLAAHPRLPVLYAVGEGEPGTVAVFARAADGTLTETDRRPSEGNTPCHLAVDPSGTLLSVANYGDGVVSVYPIDETGALAAPQVFPHREDSHAHQSVFGPDGVLYVSDLGTDEIRRYLVPGPGRAGDRVTPHPGGPVRLAEGMGPRHMARVGERWYVAGELDGTVRAYDAGDDGWREVRAVPAGAADGENHPSHLEASGDGRFVYVANRGPDTIAVFSVPGLERVAEVPCGGAWPRHFAVAGDRMYVANQRSAGVAVLPMRDGVPGDAAGVFAVGTPSCVLPLS